MPMNAVRVRTQVDSETLNLPGLKPFLGKHVDIVIQEARSASFVPGSGDWEAAERAAQELRETGYDFDAWREQRYYNVS
ncbi:MAG: hypothetical protein K8T91_07235 [Planctomycetes bacterium]|nr:hypothetical protein [Planctomycetota bacterium]